MSPNLPTKPKFYCFALSYLFAFQQICICVDFSFFCFWILQHFLLQKVGPKAKPNEPVFNERFIVNDLFTWTTKEQVEEIRKNKNVLIKSSSEKYGKANYDIVLEEKNEICRRYSKSFPSLVPKPPTTSAWWRCGSRWTASPGPTPPHLRTGR